MAGQQGARAGEERSFPLTVLIERLRGHGWTVSVVGHVIEVEGVRVTVQTLDPDLDVALAHVLNAVRDRIAERDAERCQREPWVLGVRGVQGTLPGQEFDFHGRHICDKSS